MSPDSALQERVISDTELILTGERTLPGIAAENYWFRRHEAAYLAAVGWLPAAGRVLEAGAGEGYGAALLAASGHPVVGLDYDAAAVAHVRARYPSVSVVRGNVVVLPFAGASFDAVVSMQVVEHLWDQPGYVTECARVLRPGGHFVISTPNRLTFTPGSDTPTNPFHTREFSDAELAELLAPHFTDLIRYGLRPGPRLASLDAECRRRYTTDLIGAQLASPPQTWPVWLAGAVASVEPTDFTLTTTDLNTSLDLVTHARRG